MRIFLALLLALLAVPLVAQDEGDEAWTETFDVRDFTCPLGGESFTQDVGYPSFPLLTLPDGSWLGDILIDTQIPECPGNGLLILPDFAAMAESGEQGMAYHAYTEAELARLPALIADPEYAALDAEGRQAQAYWLATKLDRPTIERIHLLQRATWAALAPELRRKRVAQFVAEAPALIAASDLTDGAKRFQMGYVVNGLRELGRFEEALALLDRLEAGGEAMFGPVDPGDMFGTELGPAMRLAIAGKDDGRFPIELLDRRMVSQICGEETYPPFDQRTPGNLAACDTRREREEREATEREEALEQASAERDEWLAKPDELERACATTESHERSEGLESACFPMEWDRDNKAGDDLLLNHARQVSEDCERVPEDALERPLRFACTRYESAVESAVTVLLTDDDAAFAIVCARGGKGDGTQDITEIQRLCSRAEDGRNRREELALLADPVALDATCAATSEDDRPGGLMGACSQRGFDIEREEREALANDEREFERRCGSVPAADYESMTNAEYDAARFCEDVRGARQIAAERAAGLSCMDDLELEVLSGEDDSPMGRTCYPIEPSDGQPNLPGYYDDDSDLSRIAREKAAQIVAAAMAEAASP